MITEVLADGRHGYYHTHLITPQDWYQRTALGQARPIKA